MTYTYECEKCGRMTISHGINEEAVKVCPMCGSAVVRIIEATAPPVLKGTGWPGKEMKK